MNPAAPTRCLSDENLDENLSILTIAKETYPNYRRPYRLRHKAFSQHPEPFPRSLRGISPLPSPHPSPIPSPTHNPRDIREERLRRNMEGINRAVVEEMMVLNKLLELGDPMAEERSEILRTTLIPEWRQHLDVYMDEIDMLTWYQIEAARNPSGKLPNLGPYWQWRRTEIENMLLFAILCLSEANWMFKRPPTNTELTTPVTSVPTGESAESEDGFSEIRFGGDESDGQWLEICEGDL